MSKVTRIVLASLTSLAVIIGIYTSVEGASLNQHAMGTHVIQRTVINLDQFRSPETAAEMLQYQSQYQSQPGSGHGCHSDAQTSSDD